MPSSGSTPTPVTQQTSQTRDPWAPAQPALQNAIGAAQSLYNQDIGYAPYSGTTVAKIDPRMEQGLSGIQSIAQGSLGGTEGVKAAQQLGLLQMQNAGQPNPYLQDILNTSNRRIGDKIGSAMSGAGRYGSGQHTDVAARAMAEAANPVLAEDYNQGLQRAGQWAQLMPTLDAAQYAPAQQLAGVGQFYQERSQKELDDQIKLFAAQQARPWEQLSRLNAIAGGAGALGGQALGSTTTPINQPSTLQKLFGGAAAGAGIGGSFGGPAGAGLGALGGGLLGMM